ncbi:MAG: transcription termination/antitermination protein NusG [Clostridia bacterium]|nr:transcription termination/antitermination protein NusG [Clostridia bacterium]
MSEQNAKWYILHTYSGYESLVKKSIEQMVENGNLQDVILDTKIPTETLIEEKNGKKKAYEAKVMPGYVFIKLVYSNQLWFTLTNTRGVTGFVGPNGKAWPLTDDEVKRLGLEDRVADFSMVVGDSVTVVTGPFEGMIGVIKKIDMSRQKAQVVLNMFGRDTDVDMDFVQIEKLNNPTLTVVEE